MPTRRVTERGPEGFGVHASGSPLIKSYSAGLAFWFLTALLCLLSDAWLVPEFLSQGPNNAPAHLGHPCCVDRPCDLVPSTLPFLPHQEAHHCSPAWPGALKLCPQCLSVLWDAAGPGCLLPKVIPTQGSGLCRRFQFWLNKGYGMG